MFLMQTLRGFGIAVGFIALTAAFVPVQWLALRFKSSVADTLPVAFARGLCGLIGIRVETFGRWEVRGRVVVFRQPNGTLASIRVVRFRAVLVVAYAGPGQPARVPSCANSARSGCATATNACGTCSGRASRDTGVRRSRPISVSSEPSCVYSLLVCCGSQV